MTNADSLCPLRPAPTAGSRAVQSNSHVEALNRLRYIDYIDGRLAAVRRLVGQPNACKRIAGTIRKRPRQGALARDCEVGGTSR